MPFEFIDFIKMGMKPLSEVQIVFSQNRGLIIRNFVCSVCGEDMVLGADEAISDEYRWRCSICKTTRSVRAVVDWCNFCREICVEVVLLEQVQIGGPDKIVEIDKSGSGKRKYHRGKRVEDQWVFDGVGRDSNRCFLKTVTDRSTGTPGPLIEEFVAPGTTIIGDCWKTYEHLGEDGYLTVNHSVTLKNPETGACTNSIEGLWSYNKYLIKYASQSREAVTKNATPQN